MSAREKHRPRILGEPTTYELSENPPAAAIRAAAIAWADHGPTALSAVPGCTVTDALADGTPVSWETTDALASLLTSGDTSAPDTPTARNLLDYAKTVIGQRLAELVLAGTGLSAAAVADAVGTFGPDEPSNPIGIVLEWLAKRFDGDRLDLTGAGTVDVVLDALAFHFFYAFGKIARQEAEAKAEAATKELGELRAQVEQGELPAGLRDRTIMPYALVQGGWQRGGPFKQYLEGIRQGELFTPPGEGVEGFLENAAEVVADTTQLGHLSPMQVRAMIGVFRIFTSGGDDRGMFRIGSVPVPASTLYEAAGVSPRNGRACAELFGAMDALAAREIRAAIKVRAPVPEDDGQTRKGRVAAPRFFVTGALTRMFEVQPVWSNGRRGLTDAAAAALGQRWAAHRTGEEWTGALPDTYILTLPPIMRKVWKSLVLSGDLLERLDHGAKEVRGPTQSFDGLDWRLFMEITLRYQRAQGRSFVDRDGLLIEYYGADVIKRARAKGTYRGKYVGYFAKAARVLLAAGFVLDWEPDYLTTRNEHRDAFEPNPDVIKGFDTAPDGEAEEVPALPAPPRRTRKAIGRTR